MRERTTRCPQCKKMQPLREFVYGQQKNDICRDCQMELLAQENKKLSDKCIGYIKINRQLMKDLHQALAEKANQQG